jgi:PAS domain S-box-containing protein
LSAEAKAFKAGQLNIGPRLMFGFAVIIFSMLAADAVVLWQFHLVRAEAERLNGIDQKLVAVLRLHTSLTTFHDRLEDLADSQDIGRLVTEGERLRTAVLEDSRRAMSAVSMAPFDFQQDPTILPILRSVQSALPAQLEAITTLAASGDWQAVRLRLANQVRPLELLTSELVEKVDHAAGEQQAQTVQDIQRVERLVFVAVPLTAIFTLLIAATLGLAVTRSITQPLARLVEGSKALARGEFEHQVTVIGNDELAHLGRVFNDTARRLRDLYATLQRSEDRLRLVIDTIPAHVWSARPDGSVDFINRRWLETTGLVLEDALGWDWDSAVHPDDLAKYLGVWRIALATGEPMESEVRLRGAAGEYRWWLTRNVPLRDESGNVAKWYGTAIDLEERHRAEDALRRSEAYQAEAQRLSKTGSVGWSVSTGELRWSDETFRIFEYDRATKPTVELVLERVHPEDVALVKQVIERASQDAEDFEHEHRLLMPDGSVKHVHVVARALRDESGGVEFVGALMDVTERKRAEEALRASENNLRRIVDSGPGLLCALSPAGKIELANRPLLEYFGKTIEELNRWSINDVVHPDDLPSVIDDFTSSMANGIPVNHELRYRRADGLYRWFHASILPVRDADGRITGWYGLITDIEDRKQSEALRDSESRILEMIARDAPLQEILENLVRVVEAQFAGLLCSILLLDDDGQHVRHGVAPSLPKPCIEAIEGASIGPQAGSCGTAMYRKEPVVVTDILQDPLWEDYRAIVEPYGFRACWSTPILAHSGKVLGSFAMYHQEPRSPGPAENRLLKMATHVASIAIDVDKTHEELRRSEAYLAEAQKLTLTGSWVWEVAGQRASHLSDEWYRIYGFDPNEGVPAWSKPVQRIHPDDRAGFQQVLDRAIHEKSDYEVEYRILLPDGAVKHIRSVGHPVLDASGKLVQFVGSSTDITGRRQAEEALRQAQADLARISRITTMGELTASLAHEVNQPIAAAVTDANTCLRWLSRDQPDLDEARQAASRIVKDATRAAQIISRVRQVFSKDTPQRALVDVNEVIREMITLLSSEAMRHSISIRTELANVPQVMADRVQLQQVLMNLMMNAIDAMKDAEGARNLIVCSQPAEDGQLMVSVSDTGVGLTPQAANQIFSAFFTTKPHGTGMGLRISRSIVESHGGRLWSVPNSSRGASFHLTLPTKSRSHG